MDAVERVARELGVYGIEGPEELIGEVVVWLTEQGIPIDKLLAREMVAVDAEWCARAQLKMGGHALSHTDCRDTDDTRQPTPDDPDDYGGGQIVSPEDGR